MKGRNEGRKEGKGKEMEGTSDDRKDGRKKLEERKQMEGRKEINGRKGGQKEG